MASVVKQDVVVLKVLLESKALVGNKGLEGKTVLMDNLDHKDHKVFQVFKVNKDLAVIKDRKDVKVSA